MKIVDYIKQDRIKRFNSTIYYRGLEYYQQDLIDEVVITDNEVKAVISGNRKYHTIIKYQNQQLTFACDCPFDGNCKHSASLYIYIKKLEENISKEKEQDLNIVINRIKDITRELRTRIGSSGIISYMNFSPIRDLIRLVVVLFRNNKFQESEELYLSFYKLLDLLISSEDNVNNTSSKEMYRSLYEVFLKIIKTKTGLEAFETHLLTCNLEKTIELIKTLYSFFPNLDKNELLDLNIIIFDYIHRSEILLPNKQETESYLADQILESYLSLGLIEEYEKFVEQYFKSISHLEIKYYQILYKKENYQRIINLYTSSESTYLHCYIIYLASLYKTTNNFNINNLLLNLLKENHNLEIYNLIKKYFPIEVIINIKDELISIYQEHNESKCYLNLCKDTGLIDRAFEHCKKQGIDELSDNYQLFLGIYDYEMIMIYQSFFYENLIKQDNVEYGQRNYYISKIYQMMNMQHGKYYVYGIASSYLEKSQYSILRGEMMSLLHSLNFGG